MCERDTLPELLKKARKIRGLTQAEFGTELGKPQSLVSKYERGAVDPPGQVIIHCVTIVGGLEQTAVSSKDIASLIESRLGTPEFDDLRTALVKLIESVPTRASRRNILSSAA